MASTPLRSVSGKRLIATLVARHQSCGACSDQSGCGREIGKEAVACATTSPDEPDMTGRKIPLLLLPCLYRRFASRNEARRCCERKTRLEAITHRSTLLILEVELDWAFS
jgi:hypothetical protein